MRILSSFLFVSLLFGWAASASASMTQHIDFYAGDDLSADPISFVDVVFPDELGCVSGIAFFLPPLDCSQTAFGGDTATPEEISITGPLGDGVFNVGLWNTDEDGLLAVVGFSFTNALGQPVGVIGNAEGPSFIGTPFPGDAPVSILANWIADIGDTQEELVGGVVVITPVPIPAAAWLFGSALLGLGMVKRRKA